MARPKGTKKSARLSVSLGNEAHQTLCDYAKQDDVTLAWLIRRAVHDMIERRTAANAIPARAKTNKKSAGASHGTA